MICLFQRLCQNRLKSIAINDLDRVLQEPKSVVLDVRTKEEYQRGHIKGVRNVPLDQLSHFQGTKDQVHYVLCQSGVRSKRAARVLQKKGYQVVNIKGGMSAYTGTIQGGK
ncbi:rhodanese-like domain-containing protein [Streptococcus pluranimalium]|uniref:Thiosulfate sulfurtransferase GlpE n=1 Tax=Streptococcus pluranimalium TaxID=82348 RepID=A0A345VK02_9STRE|nr:rhodanese-like domain-containing protein [Streptococcus pluranimalium]AXJ13054.1 Thiosulfate sulfurtransferase GlpE [Streptococcus pluranimalium]